MKCNQLPMDFTYYAEFSLLKLIHVISDQIQWSPQDCRVMGSQQIYTTNHKTFKTYKKIKVHGGVEFFLYTLYNTLQHKRS